MAWRAVELASWSAFFAGSAVWLADGFGVADALGLGTASAAKALPDAPMSRSEPRPAAANAVSFLFISILLRSFPCGACIKDQQQSCEDSVKLRSLSCEFVSPVTQRIELQG